MFPWYVELLIGCINFLLLTGFEERQYQNVIQLELNKAMEIKKKCDFLFYLSSVISVFFIISCFIDGAIITYIFLAGSCFATWLLWTNTEMPKNVLKEFEKQKLYRIQKNENDKKYNKLVNCPKCNGSGQCIIYRKTKHYTDEPEHTKLSFYTYESHKQLDGDKGTRDSGFISWSYEKYLCPFCMGSGKTYAYFDNNRCFIQAKQELNKMKTYIEGGYRSSLSDDFKYEFDISATPDHEESAKDRYPNV